MWIVAITVSCYGNEMKMRRDVLSTEIKPPVITTSAGFSTVTVHPAKPVYTH